MDDSPPPFNPEYRKGFREAITAEYAAWSNSNPTHSREEGQAKYQEISKKLTAQFPSVAEKGAR